MSGKLLTGNSAAAWGARLAGVDYIPAFPITPQTEIIEDLAAWIDRGEMDARLVTLESEHSMILPAVQSSVGPIPNLLCACSWTTPNSRLGPIAAAATSSCIFMLTIIRGRSG